MSPKPYPYNPCSSNFTHHANKIIIRVFQALSAFPTPKISVQSVFKNPHRLTPNKVLIRVPSPKNRVIRVICVQKPPPHTPIKIQIRVQKTPNKFIIRGFFLPHTSYYKKLP